jgi:hypothetical protein
MVNLAETVRHLAADLVLTEARFLTEADVSEMHSLWTEVGAVPCRSSSCRWWTPPAT